MNIGATILLLEAIWFTIVVVYDLAHTVEHGRVVHPREVLFKRFVCCLWWTMFYYTHYQHKP